MLTKKQLNQLRGLPAELKRLKEESVALSELMNRCIQADSVSGSSEQFPYTTHKVTIRGITDPEEYIRLRTQLRQKGDEIQRCESLLKNMERFVSEIPDISLRTVFRMRFLQNKSWLEIAHKTGSYSESTPRRKVDRYFQDFC